MREIDFDLARIDELIHVHLFGIGRTDAPEYSSDPFHSKRLRALLESIYPHTELGRYSECSQHYYYRCFNSNSCVWAAVGKTEEIAVALCALLSVGIKLKKEERNHLE